MGKNEKVAVYEFGISAGQRVIVEALFKHLPAKEFSAVEHIITREFPKFAESIPNIKFSAEHLKEFADKTSW
jgi:hypothetical protein